MEKGNIDGTRIYTENAIRKRTEQMNYLQMSSRLDAVVARLDTQAKMTTINKSFTFCNLKEKGLRWTDDETRKRAALEFKVDEMRAETKWAPEFRERESGARVLMNEYRQSQKIDFILKFSIEQAAIDQSKLPVKMKKNVRSKIRIQAEIIDGLREYLSWVVHGLKESGF
ncbi:hypothetical protein F8388_001542 [Cannabis sativa]|uniref:Uncharacterized protein n=1 Tax=Cannabis sativa TaxID=3483 RepID=A0A7J6HJE0_CANSA|nr:hypothetical protein F8388_001542 [Cannabis sativa]